MSTKTAQYKAEEWEGVVYHTYIPPKQEEILSVSEDDLPNDNIDMGNAIDNSYMLNADILPENTNLNGDMYLSDDSEESEEPNEAGEPSEGQVKIILDENEYTLDLPHIPGAEDQSELEDISDEIEVEEEPDEVAVTSDMWSWNLSNFMEWLQNMFQNIPRHSGKDISGIERALAFMYELDKNISNAARSDLRGVLPIEQLEKAREQIYDGIERLEERLERLQNTKVKGKKNKKKKKGEQENNLVKEGKTAKFTVVVPLFISSMARACINSMISAGKDIEDSFERVVKAYSLTKREQAELIQLLADMNYPILRPRNPINEEIKRDSVDNLDWHAQYQG